MKKKIKVKIKIRAKIQKRIFLLCIYYYVFIIYSGSAQCIQQMLYGSQFRYNYTSTHILKTAEKIL